MSDTGYIIACISFALSLSAWSATDQERQAFEQSCAAADAAWQRGDWNGVRGALAPVVAQSALPAHWRSIAQLRMARGWIVAKRYNAARTELDAIALRQDCPQVHRDEAVSLLAEVARLQQGLPARDPVASHVRIAPAPQPAPARAATPLPPGCVSPAATTSSGPTTRRMEQPGRSSAETGPFRWLPPPSSAWPRPAEPSPSFPPAS